MTIFWCYDSKQKVVSEVKNGGRFAKFVETSQSIESLFRLQFSRRLLDITPLIPRVSLSSLLILAVTRCTELCLNILEEKNIFGLPLCDSGYSWPSSRLLCNLWLSSTGCQAQPSLVTRDLIKIFEVFFKLTLVIIFLYFLVLTID